LRRVLRSAFNKAVKLRRMPSNPVLTTDQVKYREPAMRTFTLEQAERFLRAAEDDRLGALYTITLSLGLREGEGIGLKPEDIDLDNRVIPVRHQLQWNKLPGEEEGHWDELPCKWNSTGDLPMTETIYRALVRHTARRQQEATTTTGWKDSGYLFVSVTGAPLHKRNVLTAFHKSCDAAGVPRIRFHDTRHTCGTLLHAQGAGEFTIQAALRHAQLSTTRRYVHVPTDVVKEAVTRVESGIEAAKQKMKEKERQERKAASEVQATVIQPQTEMIQ
jgi:integrase